MIYFIQAGPSGPIKIGYTADFRSRLAAYETHSPTDMTPLAVMDGSEFLEQQLHVQFSDARIKGEWFRPTEALLAYIGGLPPYVDDRKPKALRPPRASTPPRKLARPAPNKVAAHLREWREAKGWSRAQAAEYLGVKPRTLESWEYGFRNPPALGVLEKLWANKNKFG